MKNRVSIAAGFLSLFFVVPVAAQVKSKPATAKPAAPSVDNDITRANTEVIRTATEYRDQLALQMKRDELEADRVAREVESRRPLLEKGYISRKDLEDGELALARARAKTEDTRRQIDQAEMVIGEAEARAEFASLPPLPAGGYSESGMFVRFNGAAPWSLADSGKVEAYFSARFGHPLPVSARGETEIHRQMKFDHRNAMDVALSPDSAEGRALMDYLRKSGIPFLAFRGKMAGSSTGAHIHIGKPSVRLAGP